MSDRCEQELCGNWTGWGCACEVLDMEPTCGACASGIHEQCERVRVRGRCCCDDEEI